MLDAFIIEQLKKIEQRRQQREPAQLPLTDEPELPQSKPHQEENEQKSNVIIIDYGT